MTIEAPNRLESSHRERLLRGLEASLREKGLQRTQIGDIVRNARTSRRTFYECFPDKESAFVELIEELGMGILEEVREAIDLDAPWDRQVDQAIDSYLGALQRDPALTVTISRDLPSLGARGAELHMQGVERYAQLLAAVISAPQAKRSGVQQIPFEEAILLIGGIRELIERAVAGGKDLSSIAPFAKDAMKAVLDPARKRT
jgi:AcrR family transcriptional regulator